MNDELAYDVVVVGAGPAGSAAAILLARAGWQVALVEEETFPRRKVCGECVAATNLPLLDRLGLGEAVRQCSGPALREVALLVGTRAIRAPLPPFPDPAVPWGVTLTREHLDTLLRDEAVRAGAHLFQPWSVRETSGTPGHFRCTVRQVGEASHSLILRAPVLIAAHGSWRQRKSVQDSGSPRSPDALFAFKASFAHTRLEPGLLPLLSFPGGYGGMAVDSGGMTTWAFCLRHRILAEQRAVRGQARAALAAADYVRRSCPAAAALLDGAQQVGPWLSTGPLRPGVRIGNKEQAFLVGNAAGEAHPIIGEGISMALQSAWLLASVIAPYRVKLRDPAFQAVQQRRYATAWRACFTTRLQLAALFAHAAMRPHLCKALLPVLAWKPDFLTQFAYWSGKVRRTPKLPC